MKIMKNGTIQMELNDKSKAMGYTMRSNINADLIKSIKKWNKQSSKIISEAIKRGDCKAVLDEMKNTKGRNEMIRKCSTSDNDKIVYDKNGEMIYWWDAKEKSVYKLEK